ncbi:murein DD-endopeptidase MepM [Conservatibacter flavescens]|uniref:Murein DD-endopeptidase MepM n=1 Tax=Conservatibacter flavescens TaxID=28161 RepID=A0A2M8S072_9PAST|nr:murein DD-endopeptidase MepM [Conservatibacter flavescens]PJG84518.1 murein DD-endopeptidase MepM [Conservatibacter flavescens]
MRHVKLARDRRKRKSRIKAVVFFLALLSIFTGVLLQLNETLHTQEQTVSTQLDPYQKLTVEPIVNPNAQPSIDPALELANAVEQAAEIVTPKPQGDETTSQQGENDNSAENTQSNTPQVAGQLGEATSYDDELLDEDDEVDGGLPDSALSALNDLLDAADQAWRIKNQFSHTVVRGDTLKDVLELSGLEASTSQALISRYPELKNLKPGQQFYWILDNHNELEYMNWLISEKEERIYELTEKGTYTRQILEKKSVWKKEVLKGQVGTSLSRSLQRLGLDSRQINQLSTALQWQVSVNKLKKGDKFALLVSREYLGDKLTGQGNVEAIHIISGGKSYYAIQAENGRYYNRNGETLGKGFARYPMQRQARISSHFNPRRKHPVTGRISPHKGVDFSVPIGTPIIAPADGVVEKVAYQGNGAGRYIILRHGREYQTVYMHLSKALVKTGQNIKKGERIALSGNTGRSTGPHLHYEFHINGRPVNPITVKLPGTSSGLSSQERRKFLAVAKNAVARLKI